MWHLQGTAANLNTDRLAGSVDLQKPHAGLGRVELKAPGGFSESPQVQLLQLTLPASSPTEAIQDSWVRGCDLVAVYAPTSLRAAQPEIYWRYLTSGDAFGWELIVSVQTELLDDHPSVSVRSLLDAREVYWLKEPGSAADAQPIPADESGESPFRAAGPGCCIVRWPSRFSYVEMIHPSDFCQAELRWQPGPQVAIQTFLFPERLEKGVIRRGRIRSWFVPVSEDVAAAQQLWQEFMESKLPLTT